MQAVRVQMAAQDARGAAPVRAHHEAQVAGGAGARRNRAHRVVGVAGFVGQHFQRVPGKEALGHGQPRLAPAGVQLGGVLVPAHLDGGQRLAHGGRHGRRPQSFDQQAAARVHQGGQRMGQQQARVGQYPAPVAGMVRVFAQVHGQVEQQRAARAQEQRGPFGGQARPVGSDEHVGRQLLFP
ncbi:hypothetical protein AD428_10725 [Achromobacter sp. DMS1]|nr:hypothetical protein AD428_10725 [Achromobacter sp. DMS1]